MNVSEFKSIIWDYTRRINENTNSIFNPVCEQYGLTMLQARILMELFKYESHSIGSLAEGICAAGTNISAMCKKLENMGLLERVRDQSDERVVKVVLTDKGNEAVVNVNRYFDEKIAPIIRDETEETFNDIIDGLKKLNDLLNKIISDKG